MMTGYLSPGVIANLKIMADSVEFNSAVMNDLISSFLLSEQTIEMQRGDRYYACQHDILAKQKWYYPDGIKTADLVSANNKLPHPYHKILVDQKAAYICGNPVIIAVSQTDTDTDAATYNESLILELAESFDDMLNDWIIRAGNCGVDWMHLYIDPEGGLQRVLCPAIECIPIFDTQYETKLIAMIRFYKVDLIIGDKTLKRYRVEKWTDKDVTRWAQDEAGTFYLDGFYNVNPAAHWYSTNDTLKTEDPHGWGRVPFVPLPNNTQWASDLKPIKELIDAYDKVASGWCDDLEDLAEQILVVKNLMKHRGELAPGVTELGLLAKDIKNTRMIGVDENGDVTNLQTEIPVLAKEKFLSITHKAIYTFGEGVDPNDEKIGNSPSGIALKFLYGSLDLKANRLIRKLKTALKEVIWFVTEYINQRDNKTYDASQVIYTINKSQIFNEKEKIDGLVASKDILSQQTQLENHPYVDDVTEELARLEAQKVSQRAIDDKKFQQQKELMTMQPKQNATPPQTMPVAQ